MSLDITRAVARQRVVEPYLELIRKARLDLDHRLHGSSDEWIDNIKAWIEIVSYIAGHEKHYKGAKISEAENGLSDIILAATAAALATGAHYPKLRSDIYKAASDWPTFLKFVNDKLEADANSFNTKK